VATSPLVRGTRSSSTNCNSRDASAWASYESRDGVSEERFLLRGAESAEIEPGRLDPESGAYTPAAAAAQASPRLCHEWVLFGMSDVARVLETNERENRAKQCSRAVW